MKISFAIISKRMRKQLMHRAARSNRWEIQCMKNNEQRKETWDECFNIFQIGNFPNKIFPAKGYDDLVERRTKGGV